MPCIYSVFAFYKITHIYVHNVKVKALVTQLCLTLGDPMDLTVACQVPLSMDSPGKNTGMDYHSLLQGIFPTRGLNPGLLHCRQTLYCLSYREALIDPISLAYLQSTHIIPTPYLPL